MLPRSLPSLHCKPISSFRRASLKINSSSSTTFSGCSKIFVQRQTFSAKVYFNRIKHPEALNPFENISSPLPKKTLTQAEKQKIYDKIKESVLQNKPKLVNPYAAEIEVKVKNFQTLQPVDTVRFLPEVWNVPLRPDIIQRVIVWQLAKKRKGTHKQKNRAEARGGGKKPWNQKKQGKARAGSNRSPIWVGGGRALAKTPRSYFFPLAKSVRQMGLKIALTAKFLANKVTVVDDLKLETHKTKNFFSYLTQQQLADKKLLLVSHEFELDRNLRLASGNLPNLNLLPVRGINPYSILKSERLFITKEAVNTLQTRLINHKKFKRIKTVYE